MDVDSAKSMNKVCLQKMTSLLTECWILLTLLLSEEFHKILLLGVFFLCISVQCQRTAIIGNKVSNIHFP